MFKRAALFLTLMLLLPTLASAYTVMVKVGSGSGSVTLTSPTQGTAITSSGSVSVAGTGSAGFTLVPTNGYTVSKILLDNVAVYDQSAVTPLPDGPASYTVSYNASKLIRSLTVYFSVQPNYYTVSVSPLPTGGYVLLQKVVNINGTWQASGSSSQSILGSLKVGDYVRATAVPATNYSCTNYAVSGGLASVDAGFAPVYNVVGQSVSNIYRVTGTGGTVRADFTISGIITAALKADKTLVATGTAVNLDATGTASNVQVAYTFTSNPAANVSFAYPASGKATFTASAAGTYLVTVTATGTPSGSSSASVTIKVQSPVELSSQQCTVCHSTSTPTVSNNFLTSAHATNANNVSTNTGCSQKCHFNSTNQPGCLTCHSSLMNSDGSFASGDFAHPGSMPTAENTCFVCHSGHHGGPTVAFTISAHWINPTNQRYTSVQHGAAGYCANNCHFKPDPASGNYKNGCVACHDSHKPEAIVAATVCWNCHQAGSHHDATTSQPNHIGVTDCTKCHDPHTLSSGLPHSNYTTTIANPNYRASYVTPRTQCVFCHANAGVQDTYTTIRKEWASSGHGDINATPWKSSGSHDWKNSDQCVRCHTAAGFVAYSSYKVVSKMNATDKESEPLTCNACHNDNTFKVRTLAAYPAFYSYSVAGMGGSSNTFQYPSVGKSNVCIPCHSNRQDGQNIKLLAAKVDASYWNNVSFMNPHYNGGAATLYGATGYYFLPAGEYTSERSHAEVGGTTDGPCVTCHMSGKNHKFEVADFTVCASCHGAGVMTQASLDAKKANFDSLKLALQAQLSSAKGIKYNPAVYGYFFADKAGKTAMKTWGDANTYGAAFNLHLLDHDPGAYAHNPAYAKLLLRDAIDFIANSSVDRSRDLTATINAIPGLSSTDKANAAAAVGNTVIGGSVACASCHSSGTEVAKFETSDHWLAIGNEGKHAAGDNPNYGCAYRCHFRADYYNDQYAANNIKVNGAIVVGTASGCATCHSGALESNGYVVGAQDLPHGTMVTSAQTCEVCHSGSSHGVPTTEFRASKHWVNSTESSSITSATVFDVFYNGVPTGTAPDLAASNALVTINPNESWNTYEWNKTAKPTSPVTCATNCHFKPNLGPNPNLVDARTYDPRNPSVTGLRPGLDGCVACHDPHKPETVTAQSTCFTCHAGSASNPASGHGLTTANYLLSTHNTGTHAIAEGIGGPTGKACVGCHDPHSTEAVFFTMSGSTGLVKKGAGCESCHTPGSPYSVFDATGAGKAPHFQTAGTTDNYYPTASYLQPSSVSAQCGDCHGHNNAPNKGWAEGGHGDVSAEPWINTSSEWFYNSGSNNVNFKNSPQSSNCVRCHTSQGFAQFVDSGFTSINTIKDSAGNVVKSSAPLTCPACHTNRVQGATQFNTNEGALRLKNFTTASVVGTSKGYKAFWGYSGAYAPQRIVTSIQLLDNRNSNLCMPCHSQRASGQEIKDFFAAATAAGFTNAKNVGSSIYPHGAQPAAIWSGVGGYEFTSTGFGADFSYQDRTNHRRIGNGFNGKYGSAAAYSYSPTTGYNNTGVVQGSCVGCHMTSANDHSLEVVNFGNISTVNGKTARIVSSECALCHPSDFTYQDLQTKKNELNALVTALGNLLVKKGITLDGLNVLPERTKNFDMSLGSNDLVKAEKNTGAWFNWYLFSTSDPAAYVHNPSYARRLLTDSIDWLDDGVLNGSAANTVLAMANVATFPNGAANPYYNPTVVTQTIADSAVAYTQEPGCLGCHYGTNTDSVNPPGIEQAPHFNTTGAKVPGQSFTQAQYVVPGTECNYCHGYGHGTDSPGSTVLGQFAESAHGNTNGLAWTDYDFKTRATCNACHTTTGFVKAIGSSFADTTAWGTTGDATKQVLACNACHASTAWKSYSSASGKLTSSIRVISGGYTAGMGGFGSSAKATVKFSDQGESNICFPCHASRENGDSLKAGNYDFSNQSFVNPHYLGSAAVWQGKGGFKWYTSTARYAENRPTHGVLTSDLVSVNHSFNSRMNNQQQQKGSCVACHMGLTNTHTFDTYSTATRFQFNTGAQVTGCLGCHSNTNGGKDRYYISNQADSHAGSGGYALDRALDFLAWQFQQVGIYFDNEGMSGKYFFTTAAKTSEVKNWTTQLQGKDNGNGTGLETIGAAMNLKLLAKDRGAAAHNAAFTKALIADSLVYLQHGNVGDRSSTDAINNISFTAYSTAITPVGGGVPTDGKPTSISNLKSFLTSGGKRR